MGIRRTHLVALVIAALLAGWAGLLVDRLAGVSGEESPGALLWLLLPLVAAVAAAPRRVLGPLVASLDPRRLRGHGADLAVACGVFPAITLLVLAAGTATGTVRPASLDPSVAVPAAAAALVPLLIKNIGEELTWRSVLTEQLMREAPGDGHDGRIDLLVGATWGLWHVPYYLGMLDDDAVTAVQGSTDRPVLMMLGVLGTAVWAPLFTEMYRRTRSLWPSVLMHSLGNLSITVLMLQGAAAYTPAGRTLFSPVAGLVPMALALGAGLGLRARRRRRGRDGSGRGRAPAVRGIR